MTAGGTEQDSVAVELHGPPARPVSAPEQEPLALPWRRLPHRTPHLPQEMPGIVHSDPFPTAPAASMYPLGTVVVLLLELSGSRLMR